MHVGRQVQNERMQSALAEAPASRCLCSHLPRNMEAPREHVSVMRLGQQKLMDLACANALTGLGQLHEHAGGSWFRER